MEEPPVRTTDHWTGTSRTSTTAAMKNKGDQQYSQRVRYQYTVNSYTAALQSFWLGCRVPWELIPSMMLPYQFSSSRGQ